MQLENCNSIGSVYNSYRVRRFTLFFRFLPLNDCQKEPSCGVSYGVTVCVYVHCTCEILGKRSRLTNLLPWMAYCAESATEACALEHSARLLGEKIDCPDDFRLIYFSIPRPLFSVPVAYPLGEPSSTHTHSPFYISPTVDRARVLLIIINL